MAWNTYSTDIKWHALWLGDARSRVIGSQGIVPDYPVSQSPADTRRNNNVIIASNDVTMSFWCDNDVVITSFVRWVLLHPLNKPVTKKKPGNAQVWGTQIVVRRNLYIESGPRSGSSIQSSQWTRDVIIASLLRQNDVATSFWRNNDVIITSCIRGDWRLPSFSRNHWLNEVFSNWSSHHVARLTLMHW